MHQRPRALILPFLVVSALLVYGVAFVGCSDSRRGISPGETAPDVVGVDLNGAQVSLHQVPGRVLLVNFWATWCGPCMEELPALQALHEKLQGSGFSVVGIAIDDPAENVREAVACNKITYPVLLDEAGKSKRSFEIKGMPESFVLDAQRKVVVVSDPDDGMPVTKIIGPRQWDHIQALQVFRALVQ